MLTRAPDCGVIAYVGEYCPFGSLKCARTWLPETPTISPLKCANCWPPRVTISRHASRACGNCCATGPVKFTAPHAPCASADCVATKPPNKVNDASKPIVFFMAFFLRVVVVEQE